MTIYKDADDTSVIHIKTVDDLTAVAKQRYAHFKHKLNNDEDALKLTLLLQPKGQYSWKGVTDKIDAISKADYKQQMYQDALIDAFLLGQTYTSDAIIGIVGEVRSDQGLGTYLTGLKKNCEADFFNLFIVQTVTAEICCDDDDLTKTKKTIIGYIPVFCLKPQD